MLGLRYFLSFFLFFFPPTFKLDQLFFLRQQETSKFLFLFFFPPTMGKTPSRSSSSVEYNFCGLKVKRALEIETYGYSSQPVITWRHGGEAKSWLWTSTSKLRETCMVFVSLSLFFSTVWSLFLPQFLIDSIRQPVTTFLLILTDAQNVFIQVIPTEHDQKG